MGRVLHTFIRDDKDWDFSNIFDSVDMSISV